MTFVLGVIYSRNADAADERRIHSLDELLDIVSVVKDFTFLLQKKWFNWAFLRYA